MPTLSPKEFELALGLLAERVEVRCRERDPAAQTAYDLNGSPASMLCRFMIRGRQGQDNYEIVRNSQGVVTFDVVMGV